MEGRVERLRCRYRVLGSPAVAERLSRSLDESARPRLAAALGESLDRALKGDPSVYVLRRVRSARAWRLDSPLEDATQTARWGEQLAGAVVHTLANDPADGSNLVRFEDPADYVASFVSDLLDGSAWHHWYYFSFHRLRPRARDRALRDVLLEHRVELPSILARLAARGRLADLLAALPSAALDELWLRGLAGRAVEPAVGVRALFATALELIERLELDSITPSQGESLLRAFRAEAEATHGDWRDQAALARGVARAFAFLVRRRDIPRRRLAAAGDRVEAEIGSLSWLDRGELAASLGRLAAAEPPAAPPRAGPTPTQRRLLEDLRRAVERLAGGLDPLPLDSPANALRLAAELYRGSEEWRGQPAATALIERLLGAAAALASAPRAAEIWGLVQRRDVTALDTLTRIPRGQRSALCRLVELGPAALPAAQALLRAAGEPGAAAPQPPAPHAGAKTQPAPGPEEGFESPVAGLFLLLRAFNDLRLPALFQDAAFPPDAPPGDDWSRPVAGTLAVALRLAGERGVDADGRLDRGLALLAGRAKPPRRASLTAAFAAAAPAEPAGFQELLFQSAAGHRLHQGRALRLFRLEARERALVAQVGNGDLWPLGSAAVGDAEGRAVIASWLDAWTRTLGPAPTELTADRSLGSVLAGVAERAGWPAWTLVTPPPSSRDAEHPHTRARRKLVDALDALAGGRLSGAGLHDADLTIGLAATVLLRAWARWLRRFSDSSPRFLLDRFLRRGGRLRDGPEGLEVELDALPLDLVLEMAGYLGRVESPWGRTVQFYRRRLP